MLVALFSIADTRRRTLYCVGGCGLGYAVIEQPLHLGEIGGSHSPPTPGASRPRSQAGSAPSGTGLRGSSWWSGCTVLPRRSQNHRCTRQRR
ncbi:hypothetical protein [Streptomyces mirabilis]|uniref:hypothetical protein n=1 Tax=Streptomyces mirabilis TaxID=68239 RepID=UPI0036AEE9E3